MMAADEIKGCTDVYQCIAKNTLTAHVYLKYKYASM